MEETVVPGENQRTATNSETNFMILSHNVVLSSPCNGIGIKCTT